MTDDMYLMEPAKVATATAAWRTQSDELRGAESALSEISPGDLGSYRVSVPGAAFIDHWASALRAMMADATAHADALDAFTAEGFRADHGAAQQVTGLMPWEG